MLAMQRPRFARSPCCRCDGQVLHDEHVDLDFRHIDLAAVLRGVDELEAIPQHLGLFRGKRLVQGARDVRV